MVSVRRIVRVPQSVHCVAVTESQSNQYKQSFIYNIPFFLGKRFIKKRKIRIRSIDALNCVIIVNVQYKIQIYVQSFYHKKSVRSIRHLDLHAGMCVYMQMITEEENVCICVEFLERSVFGKWCHIYI